MNLIQDRHRHYETRDITSLGHPGLTRLIDTLNVADVDDTAILLLENVDGWDFYRRSIRPEASRIYAFPDTRIAVSADAWICYDLEPTRFENLCRDLGVQHLRRAGEPDIPPPDVDEWGPTRVPQWQAADLPPLVDDMRPGVPPTPYRPEVLRGVMRLLRQGGTLPPEVLADLPEDAREPRTRLAQAYARRAQKLKQLNFMASRLRRWLRIARDRCYVAPREEELQEVAYAERMEDGFFRAANMILADQSASCWHSYGIEQWMTILAPQIFPAQHVYTEPARIWDALYNTAR